MAVEKVMPATEADVRAEIAKLMATYHRKPKHYTDDREAIMDEVHNLIDWLHIITH
jgi:hypothetical protein